MRSRPGERLTRRLGSLERREDPAQDMKRRVIGYVAIALLGATLAVWVHDERASARARSISEEVAATCARTGALPKRPEVVQSLGPRARDRWFVFGDDTSWLRIQYPVWWIHPGAPGRALKSEFTGTAYAYAIDFRCDRPQPHDRP